MIVTEPETEPEMLEMTETDSKSSEVETENDAEDMFVIMERFRMVAATDTDMPVMETEGIDLMILMGKYLQTVDV